MNLKKFKMNRKFSLVIIFLVVVIRLSAQGTTPEGIRNYFWHNEDNHNELTKAPEKWINESAVILHKNLIYGYEKSGQKVTYKKSIRKRIILLDKNAVNEFSEFSFKKSFYSDKGSSSHKSAKVYFGAKVIKPNGKEIEIDIDKEAVARDDNYKLAISNLEVGDIIDYYYYSIEPFVSPYEYIFDPIERTLAEEYPIVSLKININIEKGFFMNFKSINGAPALEEIHTTKSKTRSYVLKADDIVKNNTKVWYFELLEMPAIKMQVYFARRGSFKNRTTAFLPEDENVIKSSVSKEEILALYDKRLKATGYIVGVTNFIKDKTFKSYEDLVIAIYYYMRHYYLNRYSEAIDAYNSKITNQPGEYYKTIVYLNNEKEFINIFTNLLKRLEIPFEVVVATKRYNGKIEDLLIEENAAILIKINTAKPLYVTAFKSHTPISYVNPYLEGTATYLLNSKEKSNTLSIIKEGTLPVSKFTDNIQTAMINLKIKPNLDGFNVEIIALAKGHLKITEQENRLILSDYINKEHEKYGTKSFAAHIYGKKKLRDRIANEMNALALKKKKEQKEYFEKAIKSELGLSTLNNYSYKIEKNGRFSLNSYFVYSEKFDFDDKFIQKAGSNYIVEIGKFIGQQIEINEKERKRDVNIYMESPRMYNHKITLEIPEGYTIVGLDKLQKKINNDSGAFISKAKIERNSLIIQVTKQYKHNFYTLDKWEEILTFWAKLINFKMKKYC